MATLTEAISAAQANHGYVAYRPNMLVIDVSRRGSVKKFTGKQWWPWTPNVADLVATDWGFGPLDNVMALLIAQNAPSEEPQS